MAYEYIQAWADPIGRVAAYTIFGTLVAWIIHLLEPAMIASFSHQYDQFAWVRGKRGLAQFFSIAYDCIFHAGGLFKTAYEKVSQLTLKWQWGSNVAMTDGAIRSGTLPTMCLSFHSLTPTRDSCFCSRWN